MLICSSDASAVLITMTDIKGVWVWVFKFLEISGFGRTYLLKKNFPVPKQSDFFFFFLWGCKAHFTSGMTCSNLLVTLFLVPSTCCFSSPHHHYCFLYKLKEALL